MGKIELKGMEFHAYIGHYEEEKIIGTKFLVDLIIETDCSAAGKSDNLEDALDYQIVYKLVKAEMAVVCNLVENVANRILYKLFEAFENISWAEIKVSKLNPTLGGKIGAVSVVLEKGNIERII